MRRLASRSVALFILALIARAAFAQSDNPWAGFYAGLSAGGAGNNTCSSWTSSGATSDPANAAAFYNRSCPSGGTFVGGVQIGYNFQYSKLVLGIGADIDDWAAKNHNPSLKYAGDVPPPGTYDFSGKLGPDGFGIIGARIGYAGEQWLPYLRVGTIVAGGSQNSGLSYTPAGATKPTVSFSGSRNFTSTGWVAGGGAEYGLNGPWSITAEYLYANLGRGSNSTAACAGSVSACAAFTGISLDNIHEGFKANIFRVGINYWFGYWGP